VVKREPIDPKIVEENMRNAIIAKQKAKQEVEQSLFVNEIGFVGESLYKTNAFINKSLFGDISYIERKNE